MTLKYELVGKTFARQNTPRCNPYRPQTATHLLQISGLFLIFLILTLGSATASGQNLTGEIDGAVHDSTGAAIPNATVTIKNTDQNLVVRTIQTNAQGQFSAPLLAIGQYSVIVAVPGFKTSTVNNVQVHVNQSTSIPVTMALGVVSQTVKVSASQLAPQLESPAAATLINNTQMTQLSLSSRNFEQLLYIQPGISGNIPGPKDRGQISPAGPLNAATFSVNGQPTNANGYYLDGQDFVKHAGNQPSIFPGIDFVRESNFERSDYGAQYGGEGAAFTTLETKSGTTAFHGGVYDFFRSQVLDANGYFNNFAKIPRPGIRYNDYGYDVGGPVWIPHVTERSAAKTFFYFGQEFLREETQSGETLTNIPTALQRQGNFGVPVCISYAANGNCLQSATSVSTFDPTAEAYLTDIINKVPLPNNPNDPQGLIASETGFNNETQTYIRIDHQFSQKLSVFFRYLDDPFHLVVPNGLRQAAGIPGVGTSTVTDGGTAYLGHVTYIPNSSTVLEVGYSYIAGWVTATPIGLLSPLNSPDIKPTLPFISTLARVPNLNVNGSSYAAIGPYINSDPNTQIFVNATHTAGRHTLIFGLNLDLNTAGNNLGTINAGAFAFKAGALPSGSKATQFDQSFADFLLGRVSSFQQSSVDAAALINLNDYEAYLQDDFHITPRLTLNSGVRYSYIHQPTNRQLSGFAFLPMANFDPAVYKSADAPTIGTNGLICTKSPCAGGGTPNPSYNHLNGVIVGSNTSPFGDKVTAQPVLTFAPRLGFSYDVFGNGRTALRGGYGIYYMPPVSSDFQEMVTLDPPNVSNTTISKTSFDSPGNGVPTLSSAPLVLHAAQPNATTPYLQTWNLDVQQQVALNTVIDIGYFGNRGVHQGANEDINQPMPGEYVTAGIVPGNHVTTGNSVLLNQIRPYKGYGPIDSFDQIFSSNYNGLQMSFTKRLSNGNIVGINYTWSRSLSNIGTPQSIYNLASEYGPTSFNRTNILNANFVYILPFFRSQQGLVGHILGGWQTTGIVSYGSGLYLTAHTINVDPGGVGILATGSTAVGTARPDLIANPNARAPHTLKEWFNTSAFTEVPAGQYRPGNAPVSNVVGPGYGNWDLSLFKNISLRNSASMQLRFESFNAFNHTNFGGVETTLGLSDYGQVTNAGPARILQLGAKLRF